MSVQFKKRAKPSQIRPATKEDINDDYEEPSLFASKKSKLSMNDLSEHTASSSSKLPTGVVFESAREIIPQTYAGDATYTTEIDTAADRDARAILERNIKITSERSLVDDGPKLYQGQSAYKGLINKSMDQVGSNKVTGTQGPIRAPSFLRSTCRFDYAPDICKDYKETGFCGWGDNCKFLHDRGDYKSGWQLEKEWDEKQLRRKKAIEERAVAQFAKQGVNARDEDDYLVDGAKVESDLQVNINDDGDETNYEVKKDDDTLPFACYVCREKFTNPVVTLCGHYYCSACIIVENKKNSKCPICDKNMHGVFNRATKLIKKMAAVTNTTGANSNNLGTWSDSSRSASGASGCDSSNVGKGRCTFTVVETESTTVDS